MKSLALVVVAVAGAYIGTRSTADTANSSKTAPSALQARYDVLITNARIVDGSGAAAFTGDVAIAGTRIVQVSPQRLPRDSATRVIDARGHVLAPGFIDMHAHLDPLLQMPDAESAARQGVTLALGGPDGTSVKGGEPRDPSEPVFRSRKNGKLDESAAHRIVKAAAKRAGLPSEVSAHWLRYAHASHSLARGAPIHLVQATLGHASVATTGRYLHARPSDSSSRYLRL